MVKLYDMNNVIPAINLGKTGDKITYHKGFLSVDTSEIGQLSTPERLSLLSLAESVYDYYRKGLVHLVQEFVADGFYIYYAIVADRALAAKRSQRIKDMEAVVKNNHYMSFNEKLKRKH